MIPIKAHQIFDPSWIRVLMSLRLGSQLACSINTRSEARGEIHTYTPPRENPSRHLPLA
jgi:hypothetical protein